MESYVFLGYLPTAILYSFFLFCFLVCTHEEKPEAISVDFSSLLFSWYAREEKMLNIFLAYVERKMICRHFLLARLRSHCVCISERASSTSFICICVRMREGGVRTRTTALVEGRRCNFFCCNFYLLRLFLPSKQNRAENNLRLLVNVKSVLKLV